MESEKRKTKIVILGAGSFGHAMAHISSHNSTNEVVIYVRNKVVCDYINKNHINPKRFKDTPLPPNIVACNYIKEAVKGATILVHAIPTKPTKRFFQENLKHFPKGVYYLSTCKGIIVETH